MLIAEINKIEVGNKNSSRTLLKDINFHLSPGKVYTIIGKNGSGKSTLIKSLTGLLEHAHFKFQGRIVFEGDEISNLPLKKLRKIRKSRIKYVFQDAGNGFDTLKNIGYYFRDLDISMEEIDSELNYCLLPTHEKLFSLYPYEISGGMAQRLSFVLALLAKPSLIILDEPTSAVDPAVANLILLRLKEFVEEKGNSALLITQDINFALKISDEIAFLDAGKLSSFTPPDLFFNNSVKSSLNIFYNAYLEMEH